MVCDRSSLRDDPSKLFDGVSLARKQLDDACLPTEVSGADAHERVVLALEHRVDVRDPALIAIDDELRGRVRALRFVCD